MLGREVRIEEFSRSYERRSGDWLQLPTPFGLHSLLSQRSQFLTSRQAKDIISSMPTLYTIGHSAHTFQEFLDTLHAYNITHIVDVRSIPKSRHVPWFNENEFKKSLRKSKIGYTHLSKLGGLRKTNKNSINAGWRNASFRGFADYMQTAEFFDGLKELNDIIKKNKKVAIMCAEAVPWRCHRSLIADAEIVRHVTVWEIMSKTSVRAHKLTDFAVVNRKKRPIQIYYPK